MSTNKNLPAYLEKMDAEGLEMNFKEQTLKMSFNPDEFFCHSDGTILQGGFITTMLDASMAFLVMQLVDFKKVPLSIDVNVNFLSSGEPKLTIAVARINKIGNQLHSLLPICFKMMSLLQPLVRQLNLKTLNPEIGSTTR